MPEMPIELIKEIVEALDTYEADVRLICGVDSEGNRHGDGGLYLRIMKAKELNEKLKKFVG